MGALENECQVLQNYILQMKFSEFYLCNHNNNILVKSDIHFLVLP